MRDRIPPHPDLVAEAARLLLGAEQPLLLAGDELTKYGGLDRLVELLGAPVVGELATGHGWMNFPTRHPQYLGLYPGQNVFPLPFDVFFDVGGRMFSDFRYQPEPKVGRDVHVIHASVDTTNLARSYPVDVPIVAHVGETLNEIAEYVRREMTAGRRAQNPQRRAAVAKQRSAQEAAHRQALERAWGRRPIDPARLAAELNRALDPEAIVVTEFVTSDVFHQTHIDYHNGPLGRLHLASHGGNLGWGIGAACGAKLAAPRREVALLSGDGSFNFGVQGLWTAARYEIPVLLVIWNNRNYQSNRRGLIEYDGRARATGRYIGSYLGDPDVDYAALAGAYGVEGESIDDPERLRAALERALGVVRSGRPYLLDVAIARRFEGADVPWYEKFSVAKLAT